MGLLGAGGLPALLLMLFQGAGFTPQKIESMAGDVANGVGKDLARDIMQKHAAEISKKAQAEGWLVGNVKATTANPSPHALTEHEVIRDIEWRLWRSVFAVHGGGRSRRRFPRQSGAEGRRYRRGGVGRHPGHLRPDGPVGSERDDQSHVQGLNPRSPAFRRGSAALDN
jgi:hypothetical protein